MTGLLWLDLVFAFILCISSLANIHIWWEAKQDLKRNRSVGRQWADVCEAARSWHESFDITGRYAGRGHGENIRRLREAVARMIEAEKEILK